MKYDVESIILQAFEAVNRDDVMDQLRERANLCKSELEARGEDTAHLIEQAAQLRQMASSNRQHSQKVRQCLRGKRDHASATLSYGMNE